MREWFERYTGVVIILVTAVVWILVVSLGVVRFIDADDMSDVFAVRGPEIKKRLAEEHADPVPLYAGQKVIDSVRDHWRSSGPSTAGAYHQRLLGDAAAYKPDIE